MPTATNQPPILRLRQIALVAKDLERAQHLLTTIVGTEVVYVDPLLEQWGLRNILVAIGGDLIEVVSPFSPDTSASRLLEKRGDGGYMLIMQTQDAKARRKYLEENGLAKCIFMHEEGDSVCVQYHPKGIKGGVMPELDSHTPSPTNPTPLESRFSPWHACGPLSTHQMYSTIMRRNANLHLLSVTCRLGSGDTDTAAASKQWETLFGAEAKGGECLFPNSKLKFLPAEEGEVEGLVEIAIGVEDKVKIGGILDRARMEGLRVWDDGRVEMLGVSWRFEYLRSTTSRL